MTSSHEHTEVPFEVWFYGLSLGSACTLESKLCTEDEECRAVNTPEILALNEEMQEAVKILHAATRNIIRLKKEIDAKIDQQIKDLAAIEPPPAAPYRKNRSPRRAAS